jgi:hypothetical protein
MPFIKRLTTFLTLLSFIRKHVITRRLIPRILLQQEGRKMSLLIPGGMIVTMNPEGKIWKVGPYRSGGTGFRILDRKRIS